MVLVISNFLLLFPLIYCTILSRLWYQRGIDEFPLCPMNHIKYIPLKICIFETPWKNKSQMSPETDRKPRCTTTIIVCQFGSRREGKHPREKMWCAWMADTNDCGKRREHEWIRLNELRLCRKTRSYFKMGMEIAAIIESHWVITTNRWIFLSAGRATTGVHNYFRAVWNFCVFFTPSTYSRPSDGTFPSINCNRLSRRRQNKWHLILFFK